MKTFLSFARQRLAELNNRACLKKEDCRIIADPLGTFPRAESGPISVAPGIYYTIHSTKCVSTTQSEQSEIRI